MGPLLVALGEGGAWGPLGSLWVPWADPLEGSIGGPMWGNPDGGSPRLGWGRVRGWGVPWGSHTGESLFLVEVVRLISLVVDPQGDPMEDSLG